jgi:hypothetical protein
LKAEYHYGLTVTDHLQLCGIQSSVKGTWVSKSVEGPGITQQQHFLLNLAKSRSKCRFLVPIRGDDRVASASPEPRAETPNSQSSGHNPKVFSLKWNPTVSEK